MTLASPALAGRFFTLAPPGKPIVNHCIVHLWHIVLYISYSLIKRIKRCMCGDLYCQVPSRDLGESVFPPKCRRRAASPISITTVCYWIFGTFLVSQCLGDRISIPDPGRFHMPQSNQAHVPPTTEPMLRAHVLQQEKPLQWEAHASQVHSSPTCSH